jgi:hypothetical protein
MDRRRITACFPWGEITPIIAVGAGALFIAVLCTWLLIAFTGPKYDLVIINDHVIGGTEDRVTVLAVGSLFGAVAVFCALRIGTAFIEWRQRSARSFGSS